MESPLNSRLFNSSLIWGAAALSSIALSGCNTSALNLSASETLHKGYVIDEQQLLSLFEDGIGLVQGPHIGRPGPVRADLVVERPRESERRQA